MFSNNSVCKMLQDQNNTLELILNNRNQQRLEAFGKLGDLSLQDGIDIDFIINFKKYFVLNDKDSKCLCDVTNKKECLPDDPICLDIILNKGAVGEAYKIKIKEKYYVLKGIPDISFLQPNFSYTLLNKFQKTHVSNDYSPSIYYNTKILQLDGKNNNAILKLGLDSFGTQTCVHMVLNQIFKKNILNYVYQYDAFYCSSTQKNNNDKYTGFNIMDIANYGDLADVVRNPSINFSYTDIMDMFKQILLPLSILKCAKYGFIHGDFKLNNIFVGRKDNKFVYLLADFDKSSIFWKGIRFFNNDFGICKLPIKIYNGTKVNLNKFGSPYYTFDSLAIGYDIQCYSMHSEIPIFMSYDLYTLIISLLREPTIYETLYFTKNADGKINGDEFDTKVLNVLFFEDDLVKFKKNMNNNYNYYLKTYLKDIKYNLDAYPLFRKLYPHIYNSKNSIKYIDLITKFSRDGMINNIQLSLFTKQFNKQKNFTKEESDLFSTIPIDMHKLVDLIRNYKIDLNKQNKGIGNINKTLNPYKLKINIDQLFKNFNIYDTPDSITQKLCNHHKRDTNIYEIADNKLICIKKCDKLLKKCQVINNKDSSLKFTSCSKSIK